MCIRDRLDAAVTVGYDVKLGALTVTPQASAIYSLVGINGFNETGSLEPLHINSQNEDSLVSRVGLNAHYTANCGFASVTPSVGAQWQHEYLDNQLGIDSSFANGAGSEFRVYGPLVGRDSLLLTGAINVCLLYTSRCV